MVDKPAKPCKHSDPVCASCDKARARSRKWAAAHKEQVREINRKLVAKTIGAVRARKAKWAREHPESGKRWVVANPERVRATGRASLARHRARRVAANREWRRRNPAAVRDGWRKRRALKRGAFVADVALADLVRLQAGLCYLCSEPLARGAVMDHVVPLAKGGEHSPENCAAAHRWCNGSKKDRSLLVFLLRQPRCGILKSVPERSPTRSQSQC